MSGSAPVDNKENPSSDTDTLQVWTWSEIEQAIDQQVTRDKAATERIEGLTQRLQLVQESFRERFGGSAETSERGGASQSQGRFGTVSGKGRVSAMEDKKGTTAGDQPSWRMPAPVIPTMRPEVPVLVISDSEPEPDADFAASQVREAERAALNAYVLTTRKEVIEIASDTDSDASAFARPKAKGWLTRARPKVTSLIISSADEQEQDGKVQEEMPVMDSTSRLSRNRAKTQAQKDAATSDSEIEIVFCNARKGVESVENVQQDTAKPHSDPSLRLDNDFVKPGPLAGRKRKHDQRNLPDAPKSFHLNNQDDAEDVEFSKSLQTITGEMEKLTSEINEVSGGPGIDLNDENAGADYGYYITRRKSLVQISNLFLRAVGEKQLKVKRPKRAGYEYTLTQLIGEFANGPKDASLETLLQEEPQMLADHELQRKLKQGCSTSSNVSVDFMESVKAAVEKVAAGAEESPESSEEEDDGFEEKQQDSDDSEEEEALAVLDVESDG